MINRDDVIDLLKLAAVYDARTVGEEDVQGWLLLAQRARWTRHLAQRVIVEHYAEHADRRRIAPADITDAIRDARRQAVATFEAPRIPDPPPANYPAWYRAQRDAHIDAVMTRWADGHPIPVAANPPPPATPIDPRTRAAVAAIAAKTRIPGADQ